jgi:hypothetical protein
MQTGHIGPAYIRHLQRDLMFAIELAFLGHTFKRFTRTFDAILMLVTFKRQQFDNFKGTTCTVPAKLTAGVADILTDRKFVF